MKANGLILSRTPDRRERSCPKELTLHGTAAWSVAHVDPTNGLLIGVSCPSVSPGVAVDALGKVLTSTNPAHAPAAWSRSSRG